MKFIRFWLPVLLWMGLIFFLSSRRNPVVSQNGTWNFIFFKNMHLLFFAMLYALLYRAHKYTSKKSNRYWHVAAFIITVLYAISDEIHQYFVPYRESAFRDVIIDGLGAGISWLLIDTLLPKVPKKLQKWVAEWQLI